MDTIVPAWLFECSTHSHSLAVLSCLGRVLDHGSFSATMRIGLPVRPGDPTHYYGSEFRWPRDSRRAAFRLGVLLDQNLFLP